MDKGNELAVIQLGTHFFCVTPKSSHCTNLLHHFNQNLVELETQWDPVLRKNVKVVSKVWLGLLEGTNQFRYPISLYKEFLAYLERGGVPRRMLLEEMLPLYIPAKANFSLNPKYVPRDYQERGIEFSFDLIRKDIHTALLMMPTGSGKTVTLLAFASRFAERMGMFVAPAHFDSWLKYFEQYLGVKSQKVFEVRGGKSIRKLFSLAEHDEFDYDAVLFSMRTLTEFFKAYESNPQECIDLYGGTPFEIWGKAQIGFLGGDEVHESLNAVFWLQTFLHGPFHLGLSATMLHKDPFIERMQQIIYPQTKRFDDIPLPRHVRLLNLGYRFEDINKDKILMAFPRRTTYAQAAFEGSIMKNRKVKGRFLEMLKSVVDQYHIARKKPGERIALFFYRNDIVEEVLAFMKKTYPQLSCNRFIEDDPLSNILEADLTVTSVAKAGTGVDVPALITVVSFVNIDSQQKVVQLNGRLRAPLPGESEKLFVQLYGCNIPKHLDYKKGRDRLLQNRTASIAESYYPIDL